MSRSKQLVRIILLVGTIISLYFVPWIFIRIWLTPLPESIQHQMNKALDYGFDGMIVYVDQAGKSPEFYAAGWKNRKDRIAAHPHDLFKIASISKLYHAVAITKLIANDSLRLENSLADYFPELVGRIEYADRITLRMLVQHRSGIPNLTDTPDFWIDPPKSSEEALNRVLDLPASFEPGTDYEYSNTNYLLLSELIKKVTEADPFQYIKKEVLDPLGLENTFGSIHDVDMDRVMSGYYVGVDEDIKTTDYGSMVASAEDVGIFLRALNEGILFQGDEQEIYSSIYVYEHTGLIPGYQSIARYHADMDAVVIQFVNTTNFSGYTWTISEIVYNRNVKILRRQNR